VFLFRSIRRRLVSLFAGAMLLVIAMAGIGALGLMWHQEAVDDLDFLLHRSPDRNQLSRSVSKISESLFSSLDPRQLAAVQQQRITYLAHVEDARASLREFRRRIEALPTPPELNRQSVIRYCRELTISMVSLTTSQPWQKDCIRSSRQKRESGNWNFVLKLHEP